MPRWRASVAKISSKLDYSMIEFYEKLDYGNVEFQNMDIFLNSLRNWAKCWKICEKGANAHFGPNLVVKNKTGNPTLGFKKLRHKLHGFLSFLNKKCYVHNIFIINFKWQVIISCYCLIGEQKSYFSSWFKLKLVKTYHFEIVVKMLWKYCRLSMFL